MGFALLASRGWAATSAAADFARDKFINLADFAYFAAQYQAAEPNLRADLDIDGQVDQKDFNIFTGFWLKPTAEYPVDPLPYQTGFAEFWARIEPAFYELDGQNGWQVTAGRAGVSIFDAGRILVMEPNSSVRKRFADAGRQHSWVRLGLGVPPAGASIEIYHQNQMIAGVRFDGPSQRVLLKNPEGWTDPGRAWQDDGLWHELQINLDYTRQRYRVYWDEEPNCVGELALAAPGTRLSDLEIQSAEHGLYVKTVSITDYEDPNCSFAITEPCHCDLVSSSSVPIKGHFWWGQASGYELLYCREEADALEEENWVVFERRGGVVEPGGILGYWDTATIPNGYYALGLRPYDAYGQTGPIAIEQENVTVMGDLKSNTFHYVAEADIRVAWQGTFPFELRRIYDNNRRVFFRPLPCGWALNHNIRLTEDARYYWDGEDNFLGRAWWDSNFLGFGDIWVSDPQGGTRLFRHRAGYDENNPVRYEPGPARNPGEYILRSSFADSNNDITLVQYDLVTPAGMNYTTSPFGRTEEVRQFQSLRLAEFT